MLFKLTKELQSQCQVKKKMVKGKYTKQQQCISDSQNVNGWVEIHNSEQMVFLLCNSY